MENNVIISIQGKQSFEAQDDDTIELVTEGCLEPDGDDGYRRASSPAWRVP